MSNCLEPLICLGVIIILLLVIFIPRITIMIKQSPKDEDEFDIEKFRKQ
jgi:hypothetical protein